MCFNKRFMDIYVVSAIHLRDGYNFEIRGKIVCSGESLLVYGIVETVDLLYLRDKVYRCKLCRTSTFL